MELADIGAENAHPYGMETGSARSMRTMAFDAAAPESAPALDLEPERQHVYAQVNARFTMSPPVL